MGLPNPPTLIPTTITTLAGLGGGWYADYNTAWSIAGCKNTLPFPNHATLFYATQLKCCKGAYSGQISHACIKGLPSPPTKLPVLKPSSKPSQIAGSATYPTIMGLSISPTASNHSDTATLAPTSQSPTNLTGSPTASPSQSPRTSAATPTSSPSQSPMTSTATPMASPSQSPTNLTGAPTARLSQSPTTSSPTEIPSNTPTASPSQSPTTQKPSILLPRQNCFKNCC